MSKWDNLRNRLRESNRNLDEEFEQFLNESLSEESLSSPRTKSPGTKRQDLNRGQKAPLKSTKPWWDSSVEDDPKSTDVAQSWFKTPTVKEEVEIPEDDEPELHQAKTAGSNQDYGGFRQDPPVDPGVSVTMSKDSLDDVGGKQYDDVDKLSDIESQNIDEIQEKFSYTEPSGSPTSSPSQRLPEKLDANDPSLNTETGMNTQNELAEKLEFFKKLEDEKSNLDYGKLNEMLDEESSVTGTDQVRADDDLQATGVELGDSIFNATGTAAGVMSPSKELAKPSVDKNSLKPSMLSKVSLMDSLDSTVGTAQREKIKQIRQKHIDVPVSEVTEPLSGDDEVKPGDDDALKDGDHEYSESFESDVEEERAEVAMKTGSELLNTSGVGELAALQQALQAADLESTGDSARPLDDTSKIQPDLKESPEKVTNKPPIPQSVPPNVTSVGSHPDPLDQEVTVSHPVATSIATNESKGLSSNTSTSVPLLNQTLHLPPDIHSSAQEQRGIILSRNADIRDPFKPVLGRDDIVETRHTGFPSGRSTGFELPNERDPPVYTGGLVSENFEFHTENRQPPGLQGHDVNEMHGFSLQPVSQSGGINIVQTLEEAIVEDIFSRNISIGTPKTGGAKKEDVFPGEVTSDEDTPPPESLKSIKSIVKKRREAQNGAKPPSGRRRETTKKTSPKVVPRSATPGGSRKKTEDKVGRLGGVRAKQGISGDRRNVAVDDRFGWKDKTGLSSSRERKAGSLKGQKERSRRVPNKPQANIQEQSPTQLIASVESFASYLNSFVHREDHEGHTSLVEYEDGSEEDTRTNRISREQALRKEVEHWQAMWQDERNEKDKLIDELNRKDKEWNRREQTLGLQYKKEINDLKQKVFVLESRLKDVDDKKRASKTANLKSMSDEELRKLEKEICDQDQLLTGYQQENERLYEDLKQAQVKAKTAEAQMFKENQKLASEVAVLKEKLERKEGTFELSGTAAMGAERIHQLHSQLKILRTNEQEMKKEMDTLESDKRRLEKDLKKLEREKDEAVQRVDQAIGTNSQTLQDMESGHASEIQRLNRKLAWYVENQELLDKDAAILKEKNEEIKELRGLVERMEKERGNINMEKDKKDKERAGDAKRIQDLERQIREMEQIIKRRYPNSIPALIYAASSAPGDGKPFKPEDTPKKQGPSYAFLENHVKKLNQELEEREEDWARSFRVLEQKYNAMQLEYDNHVTELRRELEDEREKVTSYTRTRARTSSLEKELENLRDKHERKTQKHSAEMKSTHEAYERKTQELNAEIKSLRDALHARKNVAMQLEVKNASKKRKSKRGALTDNQAQITEHQSQRDTDKNFEARLTSLHEVCDQKDRMIEELRTTCAQLQHQRQEMLVEKELVESRRVIQENSHEKLDVLGSENRQLREQLSQVTVEMDQQRVRYQASLAEVERIARQEREASHDELSSLKAQHRQEIENIKQDYAAQHSRSKLSEMTNKIASLEIVIERLKDKLAKSAETEAELASKKVHEEVLNQEIRQLKIDLKKAKQFHTPEMQHYSQLEDKIKAMETRYARRENELQMIIQNLRLSADVEKDEVLRKWRELLRKKTEETERFRVELEAILSVLEELRQQGVVIPRSKISHSQYL
ncbi:centrosomal protein of 162 kDa-like isoform X2 [Dendronephthya gigantea]|uniref:centrosomal protein of 162 kDa-like isoform X2 n=1 Tax=Dendronephthya gigantea TaxID=151771 RepID=UPI00106A6361|nr:centrosomal protein of 162 kDa-like isoform X2 [Dendronephthya gigantea]